MTWVTQDKKANEKVVKVFKYKNCQNKWVNSSGCATCVFDEKTIKYWAQIRSIKLIKNVI